MPAARKTLLVSGTAKPSLVTDKDLAVNDMLRMLGGNNPARDRIKKKKQKDNS
jgi:hypothetical protein